MQENLLILQKLLFDITKISNHVLVKQTQCSFLSGFLALPTKSPPKTRQLLQYVSCAVFQSNSLSKSAPLSCIKISKVKIWGELSKPTLFCAPALGTFVSKYFWTGKIVGRGLSFMTFNRPVRHSACVPSTWDTLPSNRFILFIVSKLPLQLSPFINYVPPSAREFDERSGKQLFWWQFWKWQPKEMRNIDEIPLLSVHPLSPLLIRSMSQISKVCQMQSWWGGQMSFNERVVRNIINF